MNPSPPPGLTGVYPDWPQHAARIVAAVRDLTDAQLALRASPGHAPIWALGAHVASTRIYWLCHVFGEPGAERTPFVDPSGEGWEDDLDHPRSAAELVPALESTWAVVSDCLARWPLDDLDTTAERRWADVVQVHTRASVMNRLFTHEAFHAGEVSQLLGVHDLPAIDLWARRPPT